MKFLKLSVFIFIAANLYAGDNTWGFKGGLNISKIRTIENQSLSSYSFGIERKIHLDSYLYIVPQILISQEGGTIQNVPVLPYPPTDDLYRYNISIKGNTIDLSIALHFRLFQNDKFSLSLRTFPSYRFKGYGSDLQKTEKIDKNDDDIDWDNYNFKYQLGYYDESLPHLEGGWALNIGIIATYYLFSLEIGYVYNLYSIGSVGNLYPLDYKIHSIHLLFGINI